MTTTTVPFPRIKYPAPFFKGTAIVSGNLRQISLDDYIGHYILLIFYPGDFTFVCPTELMELSNRLNDFNRLNAYVICVSCDSEYCHLAWLKQPLDDGGIYGFNLPLLSDKTYKISRDYGVYDEESGLSCRATFIIDNIGIIRHISLNDLNVGRSIDELIRLIHAFKYADEYGEVCPVNWRPGEKSMVPQPEASKKYFQQLYNKDGKHLGE